MLSLALATIALTAPAQVEVTLGDFRGVGLADDETDMFRQRLEDEFKNAGIVAEPADPPIDASCYEELDCIARAVGDNKAVVDVELVRVGPFLQVKVRVWDVEGNILEDEDGMEDAEVFREGGAILPPALPDRLGASGSPVADSGSDDGGYEEPTTMTEELAPAPVEEPSDPEGDPLLGYAGIGVAVLGGVLAAGGTAVAVTEMLTLEDATSLGADKERARVLGPVGLVLAGVGVVALGVGGALGTIGFIGM
jgi:hypothetical protein